MPKAIIFSGAGASAPSGVPTFRGSGGIYGNVSIYRYVDADAWNIHKIRKEALAWYVTRTAYIASRKPNEYHTKLIEGLQKELGVDPSKDLIVYTQNVDDLHEAGLITLNVPDAYSKVKHVHGKIRVWINRRNKREKNLRRRTRSGASFNPYLESLEIVKDAYDRIVSDENKEKLALDIIYGKIDPISGLSSLIGTNVNHIINNIDEEGRRPGVVLYGEPVAYPNVKRDVEDLGIDEDVLYLIVIGTSLTVFPAAFIPLDIVSVARDKAKEIRVVVVAGEDYEDVKDRVKRLIGSISEDTRDRVSVEFIKAYENTSMTVYEIIKRLKREYAIIRIICCF